MELKDKQTKQREIRFLPISLRGGDVEEEKSAVVEGYAAIFDTPSKVLGGWFIETIDPRAFDGVIEKSDVLALLNHNTNRGVLARCRKGEGSLSLSIDTKGLRYSFTPPETEIGKELVEGLKRGDISESSFAFSVEEEIWEYKKSEDMYYRRITKIHQLYDVSPVYNPAYEGTAVGVRSFDELKERVESMNLRVEDGDASGEGETSTTTQEESSASPSSEYYEQQRLHLYFDELKQTL